MLHRVVRRVVALCAGAALALALPAPAPAPAREAHVLRYADSLDVTTLNPLLATSGNVALLSDLALAHLVVLDAHGRPQPELAEVVPTPANGGISRDGKTVTWHLRHGVRWSDGAPFTADDVVYTIGVVLDPGNNINSREGWDQIASARAAGPYTVIEKLKRPYAEASYLMAAGTLACILPKHILGSLKTINDAPYNALPVGIGPFKFTSFKRGDSVTLEANLLYFRGRPKLDRIIYKLVPDANTLFTQLQTGELDLDVGVSSNYFDRVKTLPGKTTSTTLSAYRSGFYFNVQHGSVADPAVRRALRMASDREAVFVKAMHRAGVRTESVVAPVSLAFTPLPMVPYDPAGANKILDAAGWKRGADRVRTKNGAPLTVQIAIPSGSEASQASTELLRDNWSRVGVRVETKVFSVAQFFAPYSAGGVLQTGNFDVALFSQGADPLGDVSGGVSCEYVPPNGLNAMHYCNRSLEPLLQRFKASYSEAERAKLDATIARRIHDDAPVIELYERYFIYTYDSALKNFHPTTWSQMGDMMNVDI